MIRVTKTYDGYAIWKKTPIVFGGKEVLADYLITEFTNIIDVLRYLNVETFKDFITVGEIWVEFDGIS